MEKVDDILMTQLIEMADLSIDVVEFIVVHFIDLRVSLDSEPFITILVHS